VGIFHRDFQSVRALWLTVLLLGGCGATTVTPTFRPADTLARPDRVLVHDFAVIPDELEIKGGLDAQVSGGTGSEAQTQEDIQVGKAFAKALTDNLLQELRDRGIGAHRATEAAPPEANTASIRGRFLRTRQKDRSTLVGFGLGGGQVRTQIQIFQGTGFNLRLVAEAESATETDLKPGLGPNLGSTVEADAKRTASEVAERIGEYYKRQGWIK
jgi:uncharacterized protein DUF4410